MRIYKIKGSARSAIAALPDGTRIFIDSKKTKQGVSIQAHIHKGKGK